MLRSSTFSFAWRFGDWQGRDDGRCRKANQGSAGIDVSCHSLVDIKGRIECRITVTPSSKPASGPQQ